VRAGQKAYEVAKTIGDDVRETGEIFSISGQYDLMAKFYLEDEEDIGRFVCERVQTLPHIKDTLTIVAFKAFGTARTPTL
jgi:DNA-binding Lrp family transcriptional regulator